MKNCLLSLLILLSYVVASPYTANAQKTIYGLTRDNPYGLVSINTSEPSSAKRIGSTNILVTAGAATDKNMYVVGMDDDFNTQLYSVDLTTGSLTQVKNLGESAPLPMDMSYDYATEKMFFVTNSDNYEGMSALYTMDMTTGAMKKITDNVGYFYRAIAIDVEGQIYGLTGGGELTKIDKVSGKSTMIGKTGLTPNSFQSMDFDRQSGVLYWSAKDTNNKCKLMTINTSTGVATDAGMIGSGNGIWVIALNVPYVASLKAAPSKVKDLKLMADAAGELKSTLTWTNPSVSTNDAPLTSISSVVIFRDGIPVDTLTDVKPGESSSFNDVVAKSGNYTYNVKAYNEIGGSADVFASAWIGHDVLAVASNVKASIYNGKTNTISWNAPTKGMHNGYVSTKNVTYDVVRMNDGAKIATGLQALSIDDDINADTLGRYTYKVVALNEDGAGDSAVSNYVVNGPSRQIPFTASFKTWEEAQLWTVNNLNNDETTFIWHYDPVTAQYEYIYSASETLYANDWLISPPIEFEEGKTYTITVSATNDFPVYDEAFRIYNTPMNTPNGAVALGEEFTVNDPNKFNDFSVDIPVPDDGNGKVEKFTSFIAVVCTSKYDAHNFLVNSVSITAKQATSIDSNVSENEKVDEAILRSIDGKLVAKSTSVAGLNMKLNTNGIYILTTKSGNNITTKKIVVR